MNTLASRVRKAVDERNCKLIDLANAAGVKTPSVSDWLNGTTKTLKSATASRAAQFLGVSVLWLAEGVGPMRRADSPEIPNPACVLTLPDPPEIAEVLRLMRATDDRGRLMALGAVKHDLADHKPAVKANERCAVIALEDFRRMRMCRSRIGSEEEVHR